MIGGHQASFPDWENMGFTFTSNYVLSLGVIDSGLLNNANVDCRSLPRLTNDSSRSHSVGGVLNGDTLVFCGGNMEPSFIPKGTSR